MMLGSLWVYLSILAPSESGHWLPNSKIAQ